MIKVIGVMYLLPHSDMDLDLTCEILEKTLGYSDHKYHVRQRFDAYETVCETLVEEEIMKKTKVPLEYVLTKKGLNQIIKINTKGFTLYNFHIRKTHIEGVESL